MGVVELLLLWVDQVLVAEVLKHKLVHNQVDILPQQLVERAAELKLKKKLVKSKYPNIKI